MKTKLLFAVIFFFLGSFFPLHAQTVTEVPTKPDFFHARITKVLEEKSFTIDGKMLYTQKLEVQRKDSSEKFELEAGNEFQPLNQNQLLKVGTEIIVSKQEITLGNFQYVLVDVYRLPTLQWLLVGFLGLVIIVARKQGVLSIIGMLISLLVLANFVVPNILIGQNPILITLAGSLIIAVVTVYLSHGWTVHSHLALLSMMVTLLAVSALSWVAVHAAYMVGLGSEEAYFLQFGSTAHINLQGLLLGGIMLGTLGILDDITIAQISVVFQLKAVNKNISFQELYERALAVGKDHVASLTNTLILAYTAANLPLFLLFSINQATPAWVTLNSEIIAEEVIRTLVGSMGLVLAVPLATLCAAYVVENMKVPLKDLHASHRHTHDHQDKRV